MVTVTSKTGTAKVSTGNFGKSSTGRTIKTKITLGSSSGSSSKSSSSSKRSSKPKTIRTSVVDGFVTEYKSDGSSISYKSTGKVGVMSEQDKKKRSVGTTRATVGNKVYDNVTITEALRGKLSPYTQATLNQQATAKRQEIMKDIRQSEREKTAVKFSLDRLNRGEGTSRDLINVLSQGTGKVQNMVQSSSLASQLSNVNEYNKALNQIKTQLSPQQKTFYNTLPQNQKEKYLVQVASRGFQPIQEQQKKAELRKTPALSKMSNKVASKLEDWGLAINQRQKQAERNQAKREARILANQLGREELVDNYVPTGFKTIGKGFNALIKLGEKTFTGTIAFGETLANAGEKAIFLLPALGQSIPRGDIKRFGKEFVSKQQTQVLKDIYTDPRTYRDALIGAGIMTILGGVRSGKLTAKSVKKIPKKTTKYKSRTILRDGANNLGYVTKSGIVKPVPKGFKTVIRALTRDVKQFNFRNVKAFPKTTNAKVGTVFRNLKGEIRVVTKGGKVVKPTPQQARVISKQFKAKAKVRAKKTKVARKTKAKAKKGLSKKELKLEQTKIQNKQLNSEINKLNRKFRLKGKELKEFRQAYKEFKLKGTKKSIRKLQEISDNIEVSRGVKTLDNIIKRDLAKRKIKAPAKKKVPKQTAKGRISELERKALRKSLTKKQAKELRKLKSDLTKAERFQAKIRADKQAQSKGFKDYKEQFRYEKAFRDFQRGNSKAESILKSIERKLASRKAKASKLRAKRSKLQRDKLVEDAIKKINKGERTLKQQVKPKKLKSKQKLSREETIKLGKEVESKLKVKSNLKETPMKSGRQQTVTKTKAKTRVKRVKAKLSKAKTPKLSRVRTVSGALAVTQGILTKSKRRLSLAKGRFQELTPKKISALDKTLKINLDDLNDIKVDLNNIQDLGEDLTPVQDKAVKQDQKVAEKQISQTKQVLKQVNRAKKVKKEELLKPKLPLPLPKLSWNSKKLDNRLITAEATFRERKFRNKPASKNNPIVTKKIILRDTKNRIIKKVRDRVDKSLARSLSVRVTGLGKAKKDIKKPSMKKFRQKKSKGTPVLRIVEKSKHALDTKSEKREIKVARRRTKRKPKKAKARTPKKVAKRKTKKKTTKRRSTKKRKR